MDEKFFDPNYVPGAFIEHGRESMKDKFLVIRRDGTVPAWPWLVLGGRDPWAIEAARAYADAAERGGGDPDYIAHIRSMVTEMEEFPKDGDHEFGPDDPAIIQVMRDARGGKVFIAAAWDAEQVKREAEKEKLSPPWAE
jgi:hypothetical protein